MRKHLKHFVFSLMVLGFVFASAGIISALPIPVSLVDGDWINAIPVVAISISNSGSSGGLSTARWGTGVQQSGYDFLSASTPFDALSNGTPFALGTFTHQNFPISGTFLTSIDLLVNLGIAGVTPTATFDFNHNETPNTSGGSGDNDIVTLTNPLLNVLFLYDGTKYFFNLKGFSQDNGVTISTVFSTVEGQANVATLYGQITEIPVSTPEPISLLLLGSGLIGLFGLRRKFKK